LIGGGANYFRPLAKDLEVSGINVYAYTLPTKAPKGRIHTNVDDIVNQLYNSILNVDKEKKLPIVFFGHSLGGIIAFELSRKIEDSLTLKALIVSAVKNPILLTAINQDPKTEFHHKQEDEALLNYLKSIGGLPDGLDKEMLQLSLSFIRDDYKVFETYNINDFSKVACPLFVIGGISDPSVSPSTLNAWLNFSNNGKFVNVDTVPTLLEGSHFYLTEEVSKSLFQKKLLSICMNSFDPTCFSLAEHPVASIETIENSRLTSYCLIKETSTFEAVEACETENSTEKVDASNLNRRDRETCFSMTKREMLPV
jgi:surfactin synthase thioesterase subunit